MTAKTLSVHDFGATGRGLRSDTAAIQRAIDAGAADGCEVIIPQGTWLTGALFLRTGSRLRLAAGATLLGATDIADYPEIFSRIAGVEMRWPAAILNAIDVSGVEITGSGTIDGQGPHWWNLYWGENQNGGLRREYDEQGL
ncbi:MAG: glycosyl hydrolase family 28-related protein, partial [Pluralibacter gergoviae]|nr:glycosyl hydrolase family 28-related protein [Pluralibacter gergoviae]